MAMRPEEASSARIACRSRASCSPSPSPLPSHPLLTPPPPPQRSAGLLSPRHPHPVRAPPPDGSVRPPSSRPTPPLPRGSLGKPSLSPPSLISPSPSPFVSRTVSRGPRCRQLCQRVLRTAPSTPIHILDRTALSAPSPPPATRRRPQRSSPRLRGRCSQLDRRVMGLHKCRWHTALEDAVGEGEVKPPVGVHRGYARALPHPAQLSKALVSHSVPRAAAPHGRSTPPF
eukprot:scaffold32663_cov30-Tisochrysis_lutea.AAC.7